MDSRQFQFIVVQQQIKQNMWFITLCFYRKILFSSGEMPLDLSKSVTSSKDLFKNVNVAFCRKYILIAHSTIAFIAYPFQRFFNILR